MMLPIPQHFKLTNQITWAHHRSGWGYVISNINKLLASNHGTVALEGFVDGFFRTGKTLTVPWVGFVHNTPHHPDIVKAKYPRVMDLTDLCLCNEFRRSLPYCCGLYVLSEYTKQFLLKKLTVPVERLYHPTSLYVRQFTIDEFIANSDKRVMSIGHWMRNFDSFSNLRSVYRKVLIKPYHAIPLADVNAEVIDWVDNNSYDQLLQQNIVFADLYDASANNMVIECIARNTPILINPLPAVVEYLGKDYPYYFNNLDEAAEKLVDIDLIYATNRYMSNMDKSHINIDNFLHSLIRSNIYNKL